MILVFGKEGQLAKALAYQAPKNIELKYLNSTSFQNLKNIEIEFLSSKEANFENPKDVIKILNIKKPKIVIITSAYTAVDLAEDNKEKCFQINAYTPAEIAKWCSLNMAAFITFSSDYVFDGSKKSTYLETDSTHALSVYGQSKLTMEDSVLQIYPKSYIFRTTWLYGSIGKNFFKTMFNNKEKDFLSIVRDQWGAPTEVNDLAKALWDIIAHPNFYKKSGIYHLTSKGEASWYLFALEIFEILKLKGFKTPILKSVLTSEYKVKAKRPLNSRLNNSKVLIDFGVELPSWQSSLNKCIQENLKENNL